MEQFSLEKYLENPQRKIVTRRGNPVMIVCWDNTPTMPVIVVGSGGNPWTTDKDGYYKHSHEESVFDLFFADEEKVKSPLIEELEEYFKNTPKEQIEEDWKEIQDWYNQYCTDKSNEEEELTEFEKMLRYILEYHYSCEVTNKSEIKALKLNAKSLLDLARKELQPEFDEELDKAYKAQDDVVYRNGYAQGKQDALKAALESLPKLEKTKDYIDPTIPVMYTNAASMKTYVEYNGYKLCINEVFEKLPKEE